MKRRPSTRHLLSASLSMALGLALLAGACQKATPPPRTPTQPSLRLYFLSTVAGAIEPCGCRKDMLGGVDHAAALLHSQKAEAPASLLLAAGPLFFLNPTVGEEGREQELWKARSMADSLADLGLGAWAPGRNDFAAGRETFASLSAASGATPLGTSLGTQGKAKQATTFQVGGYRVGVAGIASLPPGESPPGAPRELLQAAFRRLGEEQAQIRVALLATPRGEALRLAEQVPGFAVMALGKPSDEGEANDPPFPPTLVGDTLVIQAPNHLQAVAYVDFYVVDGKLRFADATGIARAEQIQALSGRVEALRSRLERWQSESSPSPDEVAKRQADLSRLQQQLKTLRSRAPASPRGSSLKYHLAEVRETAGTDEAVGRRLDGYYRRVNEHNEKVFADRMPAPAPPGTSSYVGRAACGECHEEAQQFWQKTGHAGAYETLSSQHKEFNLDCVGCHVTGYNRPGGSTVTHVERLDDVQCEACHGPGSRHVASEGDTALITLTPPESTCQGCHHPPHVADDWTAKAAWPKIIGPGHGSP